MPSMNSVVRKGHPVAFGALALFALIELSIAAWITAKYNSKHNSPGSSVTVRVRYILFMSVWTIVFGGLYLVGFIVAGAGSMFTSVASHFFFLFLTWILWLAAAAAITQTLGGALNCHTQTYFVYCGQLNALEGFAWLIVVMVTLMLLFVLIRGIQSARRGDGFAGGLVEA
ncbi:hypothetical protein M413DRAFT_23459 [Hebeloma cylindrosporum]|uniref:MARVEL domain-containing protein n=1 Tax=Hebeloma cylindrosporum TaxID=76867 RepID=A0A0C3CT21_HEBCY|nr:hypothetical protein M413DRAFT_23459 [Hebeloma cylindrosporum h7]